MSNSLSPLLHALQYILLVKRPLRSLITLHCMHFTYIYAYDESVDFYLIFIVLFGYGNYNFYY